MLRINLLKAHEVRRGKSRFRFLKITILAYLAIPLAVLMGYWELQGRVQNLKEEKKTLERQTQASGVLQKEIKGLKEKKEISQNRLTLLEDLEKKRHGPVRLLEYVSRILPVNQLWLTSLRENGPEIRIEGISLSNEILAEYIKRLEATSLINQVDLIQSIQGIYKNLKVKQFILIAWTKVPVPLGEKK